MTAEETRDAAEVGAVVEEVESLQLAVVGERWLYWALV